ncbi:hypothetical protein ABBQ38_006576 [Trebouxia sp. C0009 RCD-2024]
MWLRKHKQADALDQAGKGCLLVPGFWFINNNCCRCRGVLRHFQIVHQFPSRLLPPCVPQSLVKGASHLSSLESSALKPQLVAVMASATMNIPVNACSGEVLNVQLSSRASRPLPAGGRGGLLQH